MSPKRVDVQEKQKQIIEAATEVFAEKGYNAAKINDVAVSAGIGKGTVYEYFKSKEDLFFAVFGQFMDQMIQEAKNPTGELSSTASERLSKLIISILSDYREIQQFFPLTFEFWSASASASPRLRKRIATMFRNAYAGFREICVGIIRSGIKSGEFSPNIDPEPVAAVLVGALDGLLLQAWFDPEIDPTRLGKSFVKVLCRGLANGRTDVTGDSKKLTKKGTQPKSVKSKRR